MNLEGIIPKGWRLYTIDASIEGTYSTMLVRTEADRTAWHKLDDLNKENVDLYVSASGNSLRQSIEAASLKCSAFPPQEAIQEAKR